MKAPELLGHWPLSRPLALADLKGRVTVLAFVDLASAQSLHVLDTLRDVRQGVQVIVVASPRYEHHRQLFPAHIANIEHVTHPIIDDSDMLLYQQYGCEGWPTVVLLDIKARPVGSYAGLNAGLGARKHAAELAVAALTSGRLNTHAAHTINPTAGRFTPTALSAWRRHLAVCDSAAGRVTILSRHHGSWRTTFLIDGLVGPQGVLLRDDNLWIADTQAGAVLHVQTSSGRTETVVQDMRRPTGLALDANEDLVITDAAAGQIWRLERNGELGIIAGSGRYELTDGWAEQADLAGTTSAVALQDSVLFLDSDTQALRKLSRRGKVTTAVGSGLFDWGWRDGSLRRARLAHPQAMCVSGRSVWIADTYNNSLRAVTGRKITTALSELNAPSGVASIAGKIIVADTGNHRLVTYDPITGHTTSHEPTGLDQ